MFPNLRAEIARNKITVNQMCDALGISYDTYKNKMSGETDFKLREMLAVQSLFPECSLEYLFHIEEP